MVNSMQSQMGSAMDKKIKKKRVNSTSRATTQMGEKREQVEYNSLAPPRQQASKRTGSAGR
jgi:hypothetical protein